MKKRLCLFLAMLMAAITCLGCGRSLPGTGGEGKGTEEASKEDNTVVVYNYGDYIDEDLIAVFEEQTGIKVIYDVFETNEEMYPKIESGAIAYDVICAGEYTIAKMMAHDLLQPINYDNIPNIKNIGEQYLKMCEQYDPGNQYSVPYVFGTVGILYNTKEVTEPVTSWDILWDEKYSGQIFMSKSIRDSFAVALIRAGYSINSTDEAEITEAKNMLIEQKPLVQGYFVDQTRDKMIAEEGVLGVIYSGDYMEAKNDNEDLAYVVPEEGSNYWTDAWVIPANAKHKANAEAWINFLCDAEVAAQNFDYLWYSTPNVAAQELIEEEYLNDPAIFPDEEILSRCEIMTYLEPEIENLYNDAWTEVLSK